MAASACQSGYSASECSAMKPISSFMPCKAAERVEHAVAPQEVVGGGRQFVAIGAELERLRSAVIPEIARDDAILQHPPERDAGAAGRPCQLSRQREIRRQQHRGAGDDGQAALHKPGNGDAPAQQGAHDPADAAQPEQHPERGAVGGRGKGGKGEQQELSRFPKSCSPCSTRMNSDSTDSPAKMSVSSMLASQGSAVVRIRAMLSQISRRRPRHAEHAQRQLQDPQRRQRLNPEIEPEARILAVMQIETEHGGAAGDQIAFVPARQIAAGVPLQQRIAVPQRRREQHQGNCDGCDPDPGRVGDARAQSLRSDAQIPPNPRPPCPDRARCGNPSIVGRQRLISWNSRPL